MTSDAIERGKALAESRRYEFAPPPTEFAIVDSVEVQPVDTEADHAIDGASFVLDQPEGMPSLWGRGTQVLWPKGEALMIAGGQGLGKTTLAGQLAAGLLGIGDCWVLGLPVTDLGCRILYLAMDRPRQIARSLRRQFDPADRDVLRERLTVWEGPPPRDLALNPALLAKMAAHYQAGVVIVDSLKDAAVRLSEDAVGAQWNRARQHLLAQGCQLLELHHSTKRGPAGAPISGVADVYGSTWLTSGCGSIILLAGEPGDPIVTFRHVKQPAEEVGPYQLLHDQTAGHLSIDFQVDLVELVKSTGADGLTAKDAASAITGKDKPSAAEVEKARRRLNQKVDEGVLVRIGGGRGGSHGGAKGSAPATWFLAMQINHASFTSQGKTAGQINHAPSAAEINHASFTSNTANGKTAGQINHADKHVNHGAGNHESHHPFRGGDSNATDTGKEGL
ncbi:MULTISPECIES: AAA family ATPase [Mycobacterium]|uniref:AAA family ATPase n=1 Tax=Mycobacterium TaxID=1763 RepID=UPI0007A03DF5|nr:MULTISPECIES: AAA family ATPase [Mycobacterium]MCV7100916.1 AAA family ATPase [Mycobacterium palustre]MDV3215731.1 AAA family ATPase [Mycobacterium avium]